jgi:hypothetical protein
MNINELGDTWPAGMPFLSFAGVIAYDGQTLTVKPPDGSFYGIPAEPAFAASGFVGISDTVISGREILRKDWLWLKVGDPAMNDDGTQCYPILDRHGHADVKVGAIAVYATGDPV